MMTFHITGYVQHLLTPSILLHTKYSTQSTGVPLLLPGVLRSTPSTPLAAVCSRRLFMEIQHYVLRSTSLP
jgi:hypothetical protein